jgi:hypothetical protein
MARWNCIKIKGFARALICQKQGSTFFFIEIRINKQKICKQLIDRIGNSNSEKVIF